MSSYVVGTVVHDGKCGSAHCVSLASSVGDLLVEGFSLLPIQVSDAGNEGIALNRVFTFAHLQNVDGLILIGSRVSWQPKMLKKLIQSDKPVIAGPILGAKGYLLDMGDRSRVQTEFATKDMKVVSASLDFMCLKKEVVDKLCNTHSTAKFGPTGEDMKMIFPLGGARGEFVPNAEVLAYALNEIGYPIWVDASISVAYEDSFTFVSNLDEDLNKDDE
jgi:hypothetical protein